MGIQDAEGEKEPSDQPLEDGNRPDPVGPGDQDERLNSPKAAMRLSEMSPDPADACKWAESGIAAWLIGAVLTNPRPFSPSKRQLAVLHPVVGPASLFLLVGIAWVVIGTS